MLKFATGLFFGVTVAAATAHFNMIDSRGVQIIVASDTSPQTEAVVIMTARTPDGKPRVIKVNDEGFVVCAPVPSITMIPNADDIPGMGAVVPGMPSMQSNQGGTHLQLLRPGDLFNQVPMIKR